MTYQELLDKMLAEVENGDWERAHVNADGLLVEAFEMLAKDCSRDEWAREFLAAYAKVGKWYA